MPDVRLDVGAFVDVQKHHPFRLVTCSLEGIVDDVLRPGDRSSRQANSPG